MIEVPVFALLGHPNEGKSSVVSTLTEEDCVPISALPGKTRECVHYAIKVDGETLLRFVDTPGFQMPLQTLRWMQHYQGPSEAMVDEFIRAHEGDARFREDCELLRPVAKNAGIIYVVDGSRPLRANDEAEMEILRLTGRPRRAVINPKTSEAAYLAQWKAAFAKSFNVNFLFNAHQATFKERIELLQALQHIEQDWSAAIAQVVAALQEDWQGRLETCADAVLLMLEKALTLSLHSPCTAEDQADCTLQRDKLILSFQDKLSRLERDCHKRIKASFLHNVFNAELAKGSVTAQDLFSKETWEVLGLTHKQLAMALATGGAATGAALDLLAGNLTFGIFTIGGGIAGSIAGWRGIAPLSRLKVKIGPLAKNIGGFHIQVGPLCNPQLIFVLLDRALIYFHCVSNWAHAHREYEAILPSEGKKGFTAGWHIENRRVFENYQTCLQGGKWDKANDLLPKLRRILTDAMQSSHSSVPQN